MIHKIQVDYVLFGIAVLGEPPSATELKASSWFVSLEQMPLCAIKHIPFFGIK